jgi:hypothetical protein
VACQPKLAATSPPSPEASAGSLAFASRAKAGGPGRTRTYNQTVMSDRISISFVDFSAFSFESDRVRYVSFRSFLVRNWCGSAVGVSCRTIGPDNMTTYRIYLLDGDNKIRSGEFLECETDSDAFEEVEQRLASCEHPAIEIGRAIGASDGGATNGMVWTGASHRNGQAGARGATEPGDEFISLRRVAERMQSHQRRAARSRCLPAHRPRASGSAEGRPTAARRTAPSCVAARLHQAGRRPAPE